MLNIRDGRKTDEKMLYDIEGGKFFMWEDCICRRVNITKLFEGAIVPDDDEDIVAMLMATGELFTIRRNSWVIPIPDKQIYLQIED